MNGLVSRFWAQLAEDEASDRSFGLLAGAALAALGFRHSWLLVAGVGILMIAAVFPGILRRPKRAWLFFGFLMSVVVNPVVLALLFYGVFFPVGFFTRSFRRDPLRLKPSPGLTTYWIPRIKPPTNMREEF